MFKKFFFLSALLSATSANAYHVVTPTGAGCDTEDGTCYILIKETLSDTNCQASNQVRLNPNKPGSEGQYSAGLAAFMAGKRLVVEIKGCHQNHPAPAYLYVTD
ncbi:hypothetical protein [Enterovibrio norvegicus]|uniref:hypothetical protein n=1 Tax=Enterovibrio norvegicus TaxID=188144 RepID=UPI0024B06D01|nr:hypothetical protein [Enterovibrio norvegicus]